MGGDGVVDSGCVVVYLWWRICCVMVDLRGGGDEVVIESMENVPAVFFFVFVFMVVCGGVGWSWII